MSLKGMTELEIRKGRRSVFLKEGELEPIEYNKFVEAIERHKPFFIWREDTEIWGNSEREYYLKTKGHIPESYYKHSACCIPVKNENYYRFQISFLKEFDIIKITNTAQARMTLEFLEILYEIAEFCNCKLYYTATKFITKDRIESEKNLIKERKSLKTK